MSGIVVTGAAGFIGSHVCEALLAGGSLVVGVDNFDDFYDPAVKQANLAGCLRHANFRLCRGDICDAAFVERVLGGETEAVIHLAARAGVRPSIAQPVLYTQVNVVGTGVLLDAARRHGVPRFIFASSSSVYGNSRKVPFGEEDNVDYPISPYAATKKAGELLAHSFAHLYDLNITCLRFFTVYGPRQRPDLAIHKFTRLIESGEAVPVYGDGSSMRDYTYISDVVDGVLRALERCQGFRIYNIGESRPIRLSELLTALETALGRTARIQRLPDQPGDVERTFADVSRARAELGYEPCTPFAEGLGRFVAWFRSARG